MLYKIIVIITVWKAITHHELQTVKLPMTGVENGLAALTQIKEYDENQKFCRICNSSKWQL